MDNRAVGVFDSGPGGLTAVRQLRAILPSENIIYFGDTSRVPYGGRSREILLKFARQDVHFVRSFDIKPLPNCKKKTICPCWAWWSLRAAAPPKSRAHAVWV